MKTYQLEFTSQLLSAQQSLRKFALKLTSNPADASDLVQDTTLKALDAEESYSPKSNFTGWIMTIMRNTFLNNIRSSKRMQNVLDQTVDTSQLALIPDLSKTPAPDSVYNASQISQIIASLPEQLRQPFTLLIEGYSYAEIAQKLNLPAKLVKSRILNARKALRGRFSES